MSAVAAGEQREPENEQQVADDRPGQRSAHDLRQSLVDGDQRDDQLGGVAEGCVEEAADPGAGVLCRVLGRLADQPRQRDQGDRREHEEWRVADVRQIVESDVGRPESQAGEEDASYHGRRDTLPTWRSGSRLDGASKPQARPRRADSPAQPENCSAVKSCGERKPPAMFRRDERQPLADDRRRAPAATAGRGRVPPLRGALRQGRVPGRLHRARLCVRLRVRGVRPHVHGLHAAGVRRRDRSRPAAGRRASEATASARSSRAGRRCRCATRRSRRATSSAATRWAAATPSSSRCRSRDRASACSPRSTQTPEFFAYGRCVSGLRRGAARAGGPPRPHRARARRARRLEDRGKLLERRVGQERPEARIADQPGARRLVPVEVGAERRLGVVDVKAAKPVEPDPARRSPRPRHRGRPCR